MSEAIQTPKEPLIDGLTRAQWASVCKTMTTDPGWLMVAKLMDADMNDANRVNFNSTSPDRQLALHEAIGFLKFANRLAEIRDRAMFVSERGVSPDAATREPAL
jgi:hypothetical protein